MIEDRPRNEGIEEILNDMGRTIGGALPPGWGFNLLIFTYKPGSTFYISNARRQDMIRELKDFTGKLERGEV